MLLCSKEGKRCTVSATSGSLPAKSTSSRSLRKKKRNEKKSSEGDSNAISGNSKRNEWNETSFRETGQAYPGPMEPPSIVGLESVGPSLDDPEAVSASETYLLGRNSEMSDLISGIITLESQNDSMIRLLGK